MRKSNTSVSQTESFVVGIGGKAAVISQVAGSIPRHCLVDQGGDLELGTLPITAVTQWQ